MGVSNEVSVRSGTDVDRLIADNCFDESMVALGLRNSSADFVRW